MIKILRLLLSDKKGVVLFVSVLMSMSLAVVAMASMARLSETTHQTGKTLQDKRLLMYAESAANIASAQLEEELIKEVDFPPVYYIYGPEGESSFKYYPKDVTVNPGASGRPTLFGYRAVARLFATAGQAPPGLQTGNQVPPDGVCYDITIDVVEIIHAPSGMINSDEPSKTPAFRYYKGKMKTVGIISCFEKG